MEMSKETPELITECWQMLVEYIPRREQAAAAEQLFGYLANTLTEDELNLIADLDSDLAEAQQILKEDEEYENSEHDEDFDSEEE